MITRKKTHGSVNSRSNSGRRMTSFGMGFNSSFGLNRGKIGFLRLILDGSSKKKVEKKRKDRSMISSRTFTALMGRLLSRPSPLRFQRFASLRTMLTMRTIYRHPKFTQRYRDR